MQIEHSVALVTGANRGIGRAFVEELLQRGARRVYAAARDVDTLGAVTRLDRVACARSSSTFAIRPPVERLLATM